MGMMKSSIKKRIADKGKGELDFTEEAMVLRLACGGELYIESLYPEIIEEEKRVKMGQVKVGRFLQMDELSDSDVGEEPSILEAVEQREDQIEVLEETLDCILDIRRDIQRMNEVPLNIGYEYRKHRHQKVRLQHAVELYAMAKLKRKGHCLEAIPISA